VVEGEGRTIQGKEEKEKRKTEKAAAKIDNSIP
jgi:hypothetical protein